MKFLWSPLIMANLCILASAAPTTHLKASMDPDDDYREQIIEQAEQVISAAKDFLAKHKDSPNHEGKVCIIRELKEVEILVEETKMTRNEHRLHLLAHILEVHERHLEDRMIHFDENDHHNSTTTTRKPPTSSNQFFRNPVPPFDRKQ